MAVPMTDARRVVLHINIFLLLLLLTLTYFIGFY